MVINDYNGFIHGYHRKTHMICLVGGLESLEPWNFEWLFIQLSVGNGIIIPTDGTHIFQRGWNHQPECVEVYLSFKVFG